MPERRLTRRYRVRHTEGRLVAARAISVLRVPNTRVDEWVYQVDDHRHHRQGDDDGHDDAGDLEEVGNPDCVEESVPQSRVLE